MKKKNRIHSAVSAVVETLEGRRLLAATVAVELTAIDGLGAVLDDTSGNQTNPAVAYNGGLGVTTWADDAGGDVDIWARTFDATGAWTNSAFRVNTTTSGDQTTPDVQVADNGSFIVVWNDTSVTHNAIKARRYDNSGGTITGELTVSTDASNDKTDPHIGMAGDGRFVVTWDSNGQDTAGFGVYGQLYSAAGSTAGSEFIVNTTTAGDQNGNRVAMDDSGNFTVAFVSPDAGGTGIFFQRFDNTATPAGAETAANATTTGNQDAADIAIAGSGAFTVAWTSDGQDGAGNGVYFQKFTAGGVVDVAEAQGNTTTTGDQDLSSVTMADNGSFLVSYVDQSTNPDRAVVRRFDSTGAAISSESTAVTDVDAGTTPGIAIISGTRFVTSTVSNSGNFDVTTTLLNSRLHATADSAGSTISVAASAGNITVTADGSPTVIDEDDADELLISGSNSADTITLSNGLPASLLAISVNALDGNDTVNGSDAAEAIDAGDGNDSVVAGAGNDTTAGGAGNDDLSAGDGDDRVDPGTGDDVNDGGADTDTFTYESRSDDVTVRIDGQDSGAPGESDSAANFENAVGGGGNDLIVGNADNNIVGGAAGDDTLDGGLGNDQFFGDGGVDTISYESHATPVTIDMSTGTSGSAGENDTFATMENAIGGAGNDTITGDAGNNVLDGAAGNDSINAGDGDDTLNGGTDNDTLGGGDGTDEMNGGADTDLVTYASRSANLTVALDGTATSGESSENDTIATDVENARGGSGDDAMTGNSSNNSLTGNSGNDTLTGEDGNDTLTGNLGDDVFSGGQGSDRILGNDGADTVDAGHGADVIYGLAGADSIFGGPGRDRIFGGAEIDRMKGGSGNDTMNGDAGDDKIYGDTGDDAMNGGDGADYMLGGSGLDAMNGGIGDDKLFGENGSDTLNGDAGADRMDGGLSSDTADADEFDKLFSIEAIV